MVNVVSSLNGAPRIFVRMFLGHFLDYIIIVDDTRDTISYCIRFWIGKDRIIITTKKDHEEPSKIELAPQDPNEQRRGLVLPNGELNWSCPCLGGMPYGPCGYEFRQAFSCIHKAQDSDTKEQMINAEKCFPLFQAMKECFSQFPKLYPPDDEE